MKLVLGAPLTIQMSYSINVWRSTNKVNPDETTIFWGDHSGCINILLMHAAGESLRCASHLNKSIYQFNIVLKVNKPITRASLD